MIRYYVTDRSQGAVLASAERAIRDHVDMIQLSADLSAARGYAFGKDVRTALLFKAQAGDGTAHEVIQDKIPE